MSRKWTIRYETTLNKRRVAGLYYFLLFRGLLPLHPCYGYWWFDRKIQGAAAPLHPRCWLFCLIEHVSLLYYSSKKIRHFLTCRTYFVSYGFRTFCIEHVLFENISVEYNWRISSCKALFKIHIPLLYQRLSWQRVYFKNAIQHSKHIHKRHLTSQLKVRHSASSGP